MDKSVGRPSEVTVATSNSVFRRAPQVSWRTGRPISHDLWGGRTPPLAGKETATGVARVQIARNDCTGKHLGV